MSVRYVGRQWSRVPISIVYSSPIKPLLFRLLRACWYIHVYSIEGVMRNCQLDKEGSKFNSGFSCKESTHNIIICGFQVILRDVPITPEQLTSHAVLPALHMLYFSSLVSHYAP